jgi:purine-binding chemotaxis protein CheW
MTQLHVLFQIAGTDYVLAASDVLHMESYEGATRVPGASAWVIGLVQIRGRVVPVVDLRTRFGLGAVEQRLGARVIVVATGSRHVGLLVDSAREVVRIDPAAFKPPPAVMDAGAAGYVDAIAQTGARLVMRIDPQRIVGSEPLADTSLPETTHAQPR